MELKTLHYSRQSWQGPSTALGSTRAQSDIVRLAPLRMTEFFESRTFAEVTTCCPGFVWAISRGDDKVLLFCSTPTWHRQAQRTLRSTAPDEIARLALCGAPFGLHAFPGREAYFPDEHYLLYPVKTLLVAAPSHGVGGDCFRSGPERLNERWFSRRGAVDRA